MKMRKNLFHYGFTIFFVMAFLLSSCKKEEEKPVFPLSATIFKSVSDKQVAFTALTHSAVSWSWDFGDGKTSTEQNPVHVYDIGGYYKAKLTATDASGAAATAEVSLAIALTPYAMLTGDRTVAGYKGKTWRLTTNHTNKHRLPGKQRRNVYNSQRNSKTFTQRHFQPVRHGAGL